jgi:hypothetical protein
VLIISAIVFGIIYFSEDSNENGSADMFRPDKDSIRNSVTNYLEALYASKHIYGGYNVSLSENFKILQAPEKYDPFSSFYRDSNIQISSNLTV